MGPSCNGLVRQAVERVKFEERLGTPQVWQLQGQIEVTVKKGAVPADTHSASAHHDIGSLGVEIFHEHVTVRLQLTLFLQEIYVAFDGHIGHRVKVGERNSEIFHEPLFVRLLQLLLGRGQEWPGRVVDEDQLQVRAWHSIPHVIELAQGRNGPLEHFCSPLLLDIIRGVAGKRGHHCYLVLCKELRQVLLPRLHHDRQVASILHFQPHLCCGLHQRPKFFMHLRRSTSDVQQLNARAHLQNLQQSISHSGAHALCRLWGALHMAVGAGLVASQSNVEANCPHWPPVGGQRPLLLQGGLKTGEAKLLNGPLACP
mmetsp:Transcript_52278/g.87246  ORF Transcript_52278/g.87246 Transcript_52278/m.87246 type:complete len:314 (-) Transcript_52278:364-1305(-)